MERDLNNLMQQITNLPESEKNKIFNMLLYSKSFISEKDKEMTEFMTASSERLKKWMTDSDDLTKRMDSFFDELKKSA